MQHLCDLTGRSQVVYEDVGLATAAAPSAPSVPRELPLSCHILHRRTPVILTLQPGRAPPRSPGNTHHSMLTQGTTRPCPARTPSCCSRRRDAGPLALAAHASDGLYLVRDFKLRRSDDAPSLVLSVVHHRDVFHIIIHGVRSMHDAHCSLRRASASMQDRALPPSMCC